MSSTDAAPPPQRLLALDYGEARIGVAGSDPLGMMAHPLETVKAQPRSLAMERLAGLFQQRQAHAVVMGLPVRADGEEGSAAAKVREFARQLARHLPPGTPIHFQDEYRSTVEATDQLRAAGKRTRTHRPVIDQAAAVIILQDFLDSRSASLGAAGPSRVPLQGELVSTTEEDSLPATDAPDSAPFPFSPSPRGTSRGRRRG